MCHIFNRETLQCDISDSITGSLHITPESEPSNDEEMPGVNCDWEEKGNLNMAAQFLLLGNEQQADAIHGYLQQKFHRQ